MTSGTAFSKEKGHINLWYSKLEFFFSYLGIRLTKYWSYICWQNMLASTQINLLMHNKSYYLNIMRLKSYMKCFSNICMKSCIITWANVSTQCFVCLLGDKYYICQQCNLKTHLLKKNIYCQETGGSTSKSVKKNPFQEI